MTIRGASSFCAKRGIISAHLLLLRHWHQLLVKFTNRHSCRSCKRLWHMTNSITPLKCFVIISSLPHLKPSLHITSQNLQLILCVVQSVYFAISPHHHRGSRNWRSVILRAPFERSCGDQSCSFNRLCDSRSFASCNSYSCRSSLAHCSTERKCSHLRRPFSIKK